MWRWVEFNPHIWRSCVGKSSSCGGKRKHDEKRAVVSVCLSKAGAHLRCLSGDDTGRSKEELYEYEYIR